MTDIVDRTGQPREPREFAEASSVVKRYLLLRALTLPPELVVQSGVILEALRIAEALSTAQQNRNRQEG